MKSGIKKNVRPSLVTLTSTSILPDITKTESNIFFFHNQTVIKRYPTNLPRFFIELHLITTILKWFLLFVCIYSFWLDEGDTWLWMCNKSHFKRVIGCWHSYNWRLDPNVLNIYVIFCSSHLHSFVQLHIVFTSEPSSIAKKTDSHCFHRRFSFILIFRNWPVIVTPQKWLRFESQVNVCFLGYSNQKKYSLG